MSIRRIAVVILFALVISAVLPSVADAGMLRDASLGDGGFDLSGLLARVSAWVSSLVDSIERGFEAAGGATIGTGG